MQTFFGICGGLTLVGIAAGFAVLAWGWWRDKSEEIDYRRRQREQAEALRELGVRLVAQSYWFAEDRGAWFALKALGGHLRDTGNLDISEARARWRNLMEQPEAVAAEAE